MHILRGYGGLLNMKAHIYTSGIPVEKLKRNIPKWIHWYNYKRPHQSLNYSTPAEIIYGACGNSNNSSNSNNSCSNSFCSNLDKLQLVQEVKM